ncbi:MAG TPA: L,D-transpeptidase [Rhizomicrobium sp.]|jgi:lipoprotein-anchoring transpeptidase ErfK/SrfK|nr:L,D-transpeptidase [Rhizomicrobium sp.]
MARILRQLSAVYLTVATVFVAMALLAEHPDWSRTARETLAPAMDYASDKGHDIYQWASNQFSSPVQVARKDKPQQVAKAEPAPPPAPERDAEPLTADTNIAQQDDLQQSQPTVDMAENEPVAPPPAAEAKPKPVPPAAVAEAQPMRPTIADNDNDPAPNARVVAANRRPVLLPQQAPEPDVRPMASRAGPSPGELVRVAERLKSSLTDELKQNFDLFLYVSKANTGSWSQRMYVFSKTGGGDLDLLYNWPVSTGREAMELDVHGKKQSSFTPQGYYQIDPKRTYVRYHSGQWNQPMPYAMFFNWEQNGYQTGLAIHAASGNDINLLGERASAGCVRLAPENARVLFNLIKSQYKGLAPKFAYDKRTASMDNSGLLLHDKNGKIVFDNGYKVLVFIENYGGDNVVAALF